MDTPSLLLAPDTTPGDSTVLNPFVIVENAPGLIDFVSAVFGATEDRAARTPMPDGLLIHAELDFGSGRLLLADRLPGWPARPGLLQVWVRDASAVLTRAHSRGATVITEPTAFYGETTIARMSDPWGNVWWLYQLAPRQPDPTPSWEGGDDTIFATIDAAMRDLAGGTKRGPAQDPPRPRLRQIVLDCPDPRALAEFYRELLGWAYRPGDEPPPPGEPDPLGSDWLVLRAPDGPGLAFRAVESLPEPTWPDPAVPQMAHLDTTVPDRGTLAAVHERAPSLGARLILDRTDSPDEPLYVYADPAGHPFCIFVAAD